MRLLLLLLLCLPALAQTGKITGVVRDKVTKVPLPYVAIVVRQEGSQKAITSTDTNGRFRTKPLTPGTYDLIAKYLGYDSLAVMGVTVAQGSSKELQLVMQEHVLTDEESSALLPRARAQTGRITGALHDSATKEPLPFVPIKILQQGTIKTTTSTDADGAFKTAPLTPGRYDLEATFVGYTPLLVRGVAVVADSVTRLALVMKEGNGSSLTYPTYRVVCPTDHSFLPVQLQTVSGVVRDKATKETLPFATIKVYNGQWLVARVYTDINGHFQTGPLLPGEYQVTAQAIGYEPVGIGNVVVTETNSTPVLLTMQQLEFHEDIIYRLGWAWWPTPPPEDIRRLYGATRRSYPAKPVIPVSGRVFTSQEITQSPGRHLNTLTATTPGVW